MNNNNSITNSYSYRVRALADCYARLHQPVSTTSPRLTRIRENRSLQRQIDIHLTVALVVVALGIGILGKLMLLFTAI